MLKKGLRLLICSIAMGTILITPSTALAKERGNIDWKYKPFKSISVKGVTISSNKVIESPVVNKGRYVKFHVTYYTNINNRLQGGQYDKFGKRLTSHPYPVVALPSDIKYGAKVIFDEPINGTTEYINVDSGGAIRWLNSSKTECKVDIFVPNVTESWIIRNLKNQTVYGYIVEE